MQPNSTGTPADSGIGLSDATSMMASLLDRGEPDTQEAPAAAESEDTSGDTDQSTEELEATSTEDETAPAEEGESTEEEEAADTDEQDAAELPMDALVTVKVDGKDQKLPLKELVRGYYRQSDYTRKTMEFAEQRKQFEEEITSVQVERAQYSELLTGLQQQLQASMSEEEPDWDKLYQENFPEYVRQRDLRQDRRERLVAVQAEQQRVNALLEAQATAELQQTVAEGRAKLLEQIPAWKDSKVREAERLELRRYGKEKLGFSDEELSQTYDPRAVVAVYKAMKYDKMMSNRPKPTASSGPAPAKPGVPATISSRKTGELTRAKQRLAQTGRVRDAARIFESLI